MQNLMNHEEKFLLISQFYNQIDAIKFIFPRAYFLSKKLFFFDDNKKTLDFFFIHVWFDCKKTFKLIIKNND